jgi:aspartyl/glutamyl-tRNA(Asn/Gln) amidotransferase, C subunit
MIDRETVQNVARLARLGLSEEEIETLGSQLSAILNHIQVLQEADVSSVPPTAHASRLVNVMRPDETLPSYPPEVILANAPDQDEDCLKVNAVFEETE